MKPNSPNTQSYVRFAITPQSPRMSPPSIWDLGCEITKASLKDATTGLRNEHFPSIPSTTSLWILKVLAKYVPRGDFCGGDLQFIIKSSKNQLDNKSKQGKTLRNGNQLFIQSPLSVCFHTIPLIVWNVPLANGCNYSSRVCIRSEGSTDIRYHQT